MADVCISTVGDRHALFFVYYSKMKKTVFHLTNCVFAACAALCNAANVTHAQHHAAHDSTSMLCRTHFDVIAKTSMKLRSCRGAANFLPAHSFGFPSA